MTPTTAIKLLAIANTLEGMLNEVGSKQKFLQSKIKTCKSRRELEEMKNTTIVLGSEIDNINLTMDFIEELQSY